MFKRHFLLTLSLITASPLLADTSPGQIPQAMQSELDTLNQQIHDLNLQIDTFRRKALEAEAEAQQSMMSDYTHYLEKIKESEQYEAKAREASNQLKLLLQQRQAFLQSQTLPSPQK